MGWYLGYATLMAALLGEIIWLLMVKACGMQLRIREKVQQVFAPAVMGCLFTLATGGCFFAVINEISFRTNYSSVSALYGQTLTDESLQSNNIGRNGLAVTFIGIYLMSAAIKQACKVHSADKKDLKVVFEDDNKVEGREAITEDELQERIYFAKKNIISQQKFILISSLLVAFIGFWSM